MLHGSFFLSSDRQNILNTDVTTDDESGKWNRNAQESGKWNRYVLMDILPRLHAELLERIASDNLEKINDARINQSEDEVFITKIIKKDWPIVSQDEFPTTGIYKKYGMLVLQRLYLNNHRVFWTEASGGRFISFRESVFARPDDSTIADILAKQNSEKIVKLSREQIDNLQDLNKQKKVVPKFISPTFICDTLRGKSNVWDSLRSTMTTKEIQENVLQLLSFICKEKSFAMLNGVPLVPLLDGNIGTFGKQDYYIAESKLRTLFKNSGSTHIIDKLPPEFKDVFKKFSELKIKQLDSSGILELLKFELPRVRELNWVPYSESFPNREWIDAILSRFTDKVPFDLSSFCKFPLLPMTKPEEKLVQFDSLNPLLVHEDHIIVPILVKLGVRFTNYRLMDNAHENLKKCIVQFNDVTVMRSVERARNNASKSYEELFRSLSRKEIAILRTYVNDHLENFFSMYYFFFFL